jgi:hypothetical protein
VPTEHETDRLRTIEALLKQILERLVPSDRRFFTIEGAGKYAGMSGKSIRRMIAAGQLTPHRPRSGRILIDKRELDGAILAATKRPVKGRGHRCITAVLEASTNGSHRQRESQTSRSATGEG